MPTYRAISETEISVYITHSGFIAIRGDDNDLGKSVLLLLSARQAERLLADLPDLVQMATTQQAEYLDGGDDAQSPNS
jgi:hypothetical protein